MLVAGKQLEAWIQIHDLGCAGVLCNQFDCDEKEIGQVGDVSGDNAETHVIWPTVFIVESVSQQNNEPSSLSFELRSRSQISYMGFDLGGKNLVNITLKW